MTKGSSSSSSSVLPRSLAAPTCRCSRPTVVFVSWTDDNPGRRFNRCEVHGFVSWVDTADPTEWQKTSLIDARDQIRRYKRETSAQNCRITSLMGEITSLRETMASRIDLDISHASEVFGEEMQLFAEEMQRTRKMMRRMFFITWLGFAVLGASVVLILKK
ncbi:hypothetical protein Bca101_015214 [Brassica carinata]